MINKKQSGLTMISWAVVIAYLAIQGIMGLRVIPVYINYHSVKTVMDKLASDPTVKGLSSKRINKLLRKRLRINNLFALEKDKDAFKFSKIEKGYRLAAKYNEKGPIWGNLSFVADFEYEVEIITR